MLFTDIIVAILCIVFAVFCLRPVWRFAGVGDKIINKKLALLLSIVWGALIWVLSPYIAGTREPWDAASYHLYALFIGGLLTGSIAPKYFWLSPFGIIIGQFVIFFFKILFVNSGPLWPIGAMFLIMSSINSIAGAGLSWLIWRTTMIIRFKRTKSVGTVGGSPEDAGFNFGAAGITPLWLMFHGKIGTGVLLTIYVLISLTGLFGFGSIFWIFATLIIMLYFGSEGNRIALKHKGYASTQEVKVAEQGWNKAGIVVGIAIILLMFALLLFFVITAR
ncbi:MAG: hypothetical protein ABSD46_01715 [Bacteroidota bacterium]